eukprot:2377505-Pyramimonas_sp.AAC.1
MAHGKPTIEDGGLGNSMPVTIGGRGGVEIKFYIGTLAPSGARPRRTHSQQSQGQIKLAIAPPPPSSSSSFSSSSSPPPPPPPPPSSSSS